MSKRYSVKEMKNLCANLSEHLAGHTGDFPALSACVVALTAAAKDPATTPESVKVEAPSGKGKAKTEKAKPPVSLTYSDGELLLAGANKYGYWPVYYAMAKIKGDATGKTVNKPGTEYHGNPLYRTAWDRKGKVFRVAAEKAEQVLSWLREAGIPFVEKGKAAPGTKRSEATDSPF